MLLLGSWEERHIGQCMMGYAQAMVDAPIEEQPEVHRLFRTGIIGSMADDGIVTVVLHLTVVALLAAGAFTLGLAASEFF